MKSRLIKLLKECDKARATAGPKEKVKLIKIMKECLDKLKQIKLSEDAGLTWDGVSGSTCMYLNEGATAADIAAAISQRIQRGHMDLIKTYGIMDVMDAIREASLFYEGMDEIGSSDVSAMVNSVIKHLERTKKSVEKELDEHGGGGKPRTPWQKFMEAPGAETLAHNQRTVASNEKAMGLAERGGIPGVKHWQSAMEETDTGEYDARKSQPSSKEEQDKVFAKHKERMKNLDKEDVEEAQSMGTALRNTLSKVEPGSKLDKKIKHHNDMVRRFGADSGTMTTAPDGYHIDKKGLVRLGEKGVAEGSEGNWYVRVKGKVLKDKKFNAIPFPSQEAARSKAMELHSKKRIPMSQLKLTTSWMDAPEQGVAEGVWDTIKDKASDLTRDSVQSIIKKAWNVTYWPKVIEPMLKKLDINGKPFYSMVSGSPKVIENDRSQRALLKQYTVDLVFPIDTKKWSSDDLATLKSELSRFEKQPWNKDGLVLFDSPSTSYKYSKNDKQDLVIPVRLTSYENNASNIAEQGVAEGEYDDPRWEPRKPERNVDWDIEQQKQRELDAPKSAPKTVTISDPSGKVVLTFPSTGGYYGDVRYAMSKGFDTEAGDFDIEWKRDSVTESVSPDYVKER